MLPGDNFGKIYSEESFPWEIWKAIENTSPGKFAICRHAEHQLLGIFEKAALASAKDKGFIPLLDRDITDLTLEQQAEEEELRFLPYQDGEDHPGQVLLKKVMLVAAQCEQTRAVNVSSLSDAEKTTFSALQLEMNRFQIAFVEHIKASSKWLEEKSTLSRWAKPSESACFTNYNDSLQKLSDMSNEITQGFPQLTLSFPPLIRTRLDLEYAFPNFIL